MDRFYDRIKDKIQHYEKDANLPEEGAPDFEWDRIAAQKVQTQNWRKPFMYIAGSVILTSLFWVCLLINQNNKSSNFETQQSPKTIVINNESLDLELELNTDLTLQTKNDKGNVDNASNPFLKTYESNNNQTSLNINNPAKPLTDNELIKKTNQPSLHVNNTNTENLMQQVIPKMSFQPNTDDSNQEIETTKSIVDRTEQDKDAEIVEKKNNIVTFSKSFDLELVGNENLLTTDQEMLTNKRQLSYINLLKREITDIPLNDQPSINLGIDPFIKPHNTKSSIQHSMKVFMGYSFNNFNSTYKPIKPDSKSFIQELKGQNILFGASYNLQRPKGFGMELGIQFEKMSFLIEKKATFKIDEKFIEKFADREEISNEVIVSSGLSFRAVSTTVIAPKDGELSKTDSLSYVINFKARFSKIEIPLLINYSLPIGQRSTITFLGGPEFQIVKEQGLDKFVVDRFDNKGKKFDKFQGKESKTINGTAKNLNNTLTSVNVRLGIGYEYAVSNSFSLFSDVNFAKNIKNIYSADNFKINLSNIDVRIGSKFFL